MEIEKPCPFCGTPPKCEDEHEANSKVMFEPNTPYDDIFCVTCIICGARGSKSKTEQEAIQKWNGGLTVRDKRIDQLEDALGLVIEELSQRTCCEIKVGGETLVEFVERTLKQSGSASEVR